MEKNTYIQPQISALQFADPVMDVIVESPGDAPVVDNGEELGAEGTSVWDSEWDSAPSSVWEEE